VQDTSGMYTPQKISASPRAVVLFESKVTSGGQKAANLSRVKVGGVEGVHTFDER